MDNAWIQLEHGMQVTEFMEGDEGETGGDPESDE